MPRPLSSDRRGPCLSCDQSWQQPSEGIPQAGRLSSFSSGVGRHQERKSFELFGYCLMSNHFHLLIRPTGDSISRILQSLLIIHTQRYHRHYQSGGHVWQGRFESPVVQNDEHLLAVLRYIEANPLRARLVQHVDDYRWSSYGVHGRGDASELVDRLVVYEELSPYPQVRQRKWSEKVHLPMDGPTSLAIRRSVETGLPYGSQRWVRSLATKLHLDLTVRPRGRPKKQASR
jgi:putative transposase